jgi:hypothetical protein
MTKQAARAQNKIEKSIDTCYKIFNPSPAVIIHCDNVHIPSLKSIAM